MAKPGIQIRQSRIELLGHSPDDWQTYFPIYGPMLPGSHEVISLSDRYFISLGAHAYHMTLLMNRDHDQPLTVEKSFNACALLAYVTDSPVVPQHYEEIQDKLAASNVQSFFSAIKLAGFPAIKEYFESLSAVAEAVLPFANYASKRTNVMRLLPDPGRGEWLFIEWPGTPETWRALSAYWSAMLSICLPGRILNYWRAAEAVMSMNQIKQVFTQLQSKCPLPVETSERMHHKTKTEIKDKDVMVDLKRLAMERRDDLIRTHGEVEKAFKWLYWERRGKAAHADKYSLEYDGLESFADQIKDASLFQYIARIAIEETWE